MAITPQTATSVFNVQVLSHFLIPYLLLSRPEPVLRKGAQICNIASPGEKNRNIDVDDLLCLKALEAGTFSLFTDAVKFFFMMDLFTHVSRSEVLPVYVVYIIEQEFNIRFPDTHTTHVYPGSVATSSFEHPTVPWVVRILLRVFLFVAARSTAQYADVVIWEIASEESKILARTFWDQYGREVDVDKRVKTDPQLRMRVWENLLQFGGMS
jgi:hypothetical protein